MIFVIEERGEIRRELVKRCGIRINHLMFANDCNLFCRARVTEWLKLQDILHKYEKGSSQVQNKQKSSFFFSFNTKDNKKRSITKVAGGGVCGNYENYLG